MKALLFVALLQPAAVCNPDPVSPGLSSLGDVVGEVAPCSMSLSEAIESMRGTPQARALLESASAAIAKETGVPISAEMLETFLANPAAAESAMTVSVPQVVDALKKAQVVSGGRDPEPIAFKLPSGVDLADAPSYFDGAIEGPKEIAPGILRGDAPSDLPPEEVKTRRAFGEILDRLASNAGVPASDRFRVTYRGRSYSTIDGFLGALRASGHSVSAGVSQGVANFVDLQLKRPDGGSCEVRTPVLVKTGHFAPDGTELLVPAVHSGLKLDIAGPDVSARVSFFQGVGGTRFFAEGLGKDQSWVGGKIVERFEGDDAVRAASIAGLWRDSVEDMVASDRLVGGGYGQTGVCNDSVALIQLMITGRTTIYPLAMDHERVLRHLDAKIAEGGPLARRYRSLRDAVTRLPFDGGAGDSSQKDRILESIPYGAGSTPFPEADLTRRVLRGEI